METIQELGKIAGIAGIGIGVLLFLFKDVIAKNIFPMMSGDQGYKTIKLLLYMIWSTAIIGIGLWFFFEYSKLNSNNESSQIDVPTQHDPKQTDTTTQNKPADERQSEHESKPSKEGERKTVDGQRTERKPTQPKDGGGVYTTIENSGTIGNVISGEEVEVEVKNQKIDTSIRHENE